MGNSVSKKKTNKKQKLKKKLTTKAMVRGNSGIKKYIYLIKFINKKTRKYKN